MPPSVFHGRWAIGYHVSNWKKRPGDSGWFWNWKPCFAWMPERSAPKASILFSQRIFWLLNQGSLSTQTKDIKRRIFWNITLGYKPERHSAKYNKVSEKCEYGINLLSTKNVPLFPPPPLSVEVDIGDDKWQPTGGHTMVRDEETKPPNCVSSYIRGYKILWIKFHLKTWRKDTESSWKMNRYMNKIVSSPFYIFGYSTRFFFIPLAYSEIHKKFLTESDRPQKPFIRLHSGRQSYRTTVSHQSQETDNDWHGCVQDLVLGFRGITGPEGYPQTAGRWAHQAKHPCLSWQHLLSPPQGKEPREMLIRELDWVRLSWGVQSKGPGNGGLRSETNFESKESFVML